MLPGANIPSPSGNPNRLSTCCRTAHSTSTKTGATSYVWLKHDTLSNFTKLNRFKKKTGKVIIMYLAWVDAVYKEKDRYCVECESISQKKIMILSPTIFNMNFWFPTFQL